MTPRQISKLLFIAMFCLPYTLQAESTQELIKRLANASREQSWVLATDCPLEQAAVRQFDFGGGSYGCADGTGNDTEQSIAAALERPWVYRWGGKEDPSQLMTVNELKKVAADFIGYAEQDEQKDRRVYSGAHCNATIARLTACAYRVAATRRDGVTPVSSASAATVADQCPRDAVAVANKALQSIDQELTAFMDSDAGQQTGTSTPLLQLVMWGTNEQIKVIQQYCPQAGSFQQRTEDLTASYQSALKACRTIQSRPEICMPAHPQQLATKHENNRGTSIGNAPSSAHANTNSSNAVSYDPVTGTCIGGLECCQLPSYSDSHAECASQDSSSGQGQIRTAR